MARELLAGQKNNQYRIIIGKNSISQKNISSFTKGHKKLLIISDTGVPKDIIQNITSLSKLKSKVFTIILNQGEKAKQYLLKRGLNEASLKLFNVGFVPENSSYLFNSINY